MDGPERYVVVPDGENENAWWEVWDMANQTPMLETSDRLEAEAEAERLNFEHGDHGG